MKPYFSAPEHDAVAQAAAEWVLRHDRGLTAAEQDDFSQWLAADPRHRAAWAEHRWGWEELDRLAGLQSSVHAVPDPDLLAPRRGLRAVRLLQPVLAAAAAVVVGLVLYRIGAPPAPAPAVPPPAPLALIERRELGDGSTIELNRGAVVTEHFTPAERRVRLDRGEAHFTVAHDAGRPFVVEAGGVAVRAVGTAFNVRLESSSVEVLVTEGRVAVGDQGPETAEGGYQGPAAGRSSPLGAGLLAPVMLGAGERTVVSLSPNAPAPQVSAVSAAEIEARLAWQPRLLDFTGAPLAEIVAEFNRRNPVRLVLGDAALGGLRLSATFRSDNVEGFVRLLASDFGVHAEWRDDGEIVLTPAP